MIQNRVTANRIGAVFPGGRESWPNVCSLDVEAIRVAAMTIGAANLHAVDRMHVSDVGVTVDAALAFCECIAGGLANQIDVP